MVSVSGVISNFDGGERVLRCARSLRAQQPAFDELIVVDSGSRDGSPAALRAADPALTLLELGANLGPSAARNAGLRRARSELVLLIDHDLYAQPGCLARLLEAKEQSGASAVAPRVVLLPERDIVQADGAAAHFAGTLVLRHGYRPAAEVSAERARVAALLGGCLLLERACALAAGGFDEAFFFYFEDLEFSLRMRGLGHELVCEPAAVVEHDRREGTPGLAFRGREPYPERRAYLTMRNRLQSILLHYRLRTLALLAPALLLYELATLGEALRRGWLSAWLRAWLWQLAHARDILRRRALHQRRRRLGDREILCGGPIPFAPGFLTARRDERVVAALSRVLDRYWRAVERWLH